MKSYLKPFRVAIRRDGREVRANADQLDGKTFLFRLGWGMDDQDPYPGERAMVPEDPDYPKDAPPWIASGDLQP